MMILSRLCFVIFLLTSINTKADSTDDDYLFSLTIEELLKVKVSVATAKSSELKEVPTLVSVYNDEEIQLLGYESLNELTRITPGYNYYQLFGEKVYTTRGQKAGSFNNNKHLTLIDGLPFYHARSGKSFTEMDLPVSFAKQVEFLRGPASSLYGTGAFFGAVEVSTSRASNYGLETKMKLAAASERNAYKTQVSFKNKNNNYDSLINISQFSQSETLLPTSYLVNGENLSRDDQESLFLQASYIVTKNNLSGFEFGLLYSRKAGGMGEGFLLGDHTSPLNKLIWETTQPYLKLDKKLSNNRSIKGYLFNNRSKETGVFTPFNRTSYPGAGSADDVYHHYSSMVDNTGLELKLVENFENSTLTYGVAYDQRDDQGWFALNRSPIGELDSEGKLPDPNVKVYSAFIENQISINIMSGATFVWGARYDSGESQNDNYDNVSPRLSYVQHFDSHWSIRTSYAEALRAPGIKEYGLNQEVEEGGELGFAIPELKPELFKAAELSFTYHTTDMSVSLSYFDNKTLDALDSNSGGINYFTNDAGETNASGFELEARVNLTSSSMLRWISDIASASKPNGEKVQDIPKMTNTLSFISKPSDSWVDQYSVVLSHWSETENAIPDSNASKSILWLDANFTWQLNENSFLSFKIENGLDESFSFLENGVPRSPSSGRQMWLSLESVF